MCNLLRKFFKKIFNRSPQREMQQIPLRERCASSLAASSLSSSLPESSAAIKDEINCSWPRILIVQFLTSVDRLYEFFFFPLMQRFVPSPILDNTLQARICICGGPLSNNVTIKGRTPSTTTSCIYTFPSPGLLSVQHRGE